jgi:hypothetical protein
MTAPTVDDLLRLIRDRGTPDRFPDIEELDSLLDPFRTIRDQEGLCLALVATIRKGDRLVARVAAEALARLGGAGAVSSLVAIATDEKASLQPRAAAAWSLSRLVTDPGTGLSQEETLICATLPVLEMVSDPEADGGFGLESLLDSYTAFSAQDRLPFVRMLAELARREGKGIAAICLHLLKAEKAPEARRALIDMMVDEGSQEAADLLATFAATAATAEEAKQARRHLHVLRTRGIRGVVRSDLEGARAFVTGVDGDACLAVNIIIPRAPTFDFANFLLHLGSGIRDAFVRRNLSRGSLEELLENISSKFDVSAFIPMPLAARMVDEALALARPEALAEPDIAEAIALTRPALDVARRPPLPNPPTGDDADVPLERIKALLESPGFETWFFEAGEATVRPAVEAMRKPGRGKSGRLSPATYRKRLIGETAHLCERLIATGEPIRLERMLRFQGHVLACAEDHERATMCRKLAREVLSPGSSFLLCMATASLLRALEAPEEPSGDVFLDVRAKLRARLLATEARRPKERRKADVAELDLATAAFLSLNAINREAPSSHRASLTRVENVALVAGKLMAEAFTHNSGGSTKAPEIHRAIVASMKENDLFGPSKRHGLAVELIRALTEFVDELCTDRCPHGCLDAARDDGRLLFHSRNLPWDVDARQLAQPRGTTQALRE